MQAYESAYSMLLSTAGIENTETRDTYDGHTECYETGWRMVSGRLYVG